MAQSRRTTSRGASSGRRTAGRTARKTKKKAAKKTAKGTAKRTARAGSGARRERPLAKSGAVKRKTRSRAATRPRTARVARKSAATAAGRRTTRRARPAGGQGNVIRVGLQLGNTRTRIAASNEGDPVSLRRDTFPNIVGFLKLDGGRGGGRGRPPGGTDVLFEEEAFQHRRQLDLRRPIRSGIVVDVGICRQFAAHLASVVDPRSSGCLWAVASVPARATAEEWERTRRGLTGTFQRVVLVPEPRLAAEGIRLDRSLRSSALGEDPGRHSLVIDIGATTTELCLVRGDIAADYEHATLEKAGTWIDERIITQGLVRYPSLCLTHRTAREIKEEQAFVGAADREARTGLPSTELLALTEVIREGCEEILREIVEASCALLSRCSRDDLTAVSRHVILTGGGSRIRNLPARLESLLHARGFADARVLVPEDTASLSARGALRLAEALGEEEWEALAVLKPAEHLAGLTAVTVPGTTHAARPAHAHAPATAPAHPARPEPPVPSALPDLPLEGDFCAEDLDELEFFRGL